MDETSADKRQAFRDRYYGRGFTAAYSVEVLPGQTPATCMHVATNAPPSIVEHQLADGRTIITTSYREGVMPHDTETRERLKFTAEQPDAKPDPASHQTGWDYKKIDGRWCVGMAGNLDTVHDAVLTVNTHTDDEAARRIAQWVASTYTHTGGPDGSMLGDWEMIFTVEGEALSTATLDEALSEAAADAAADPDITNVRVVGHKGLKAVLVKRKKVEPLELKLTIEVPDIVHETLARLEEAAAEDADSPEVRGLKNVALALERDIDTLSTMPDDHGVDVVWAVEEAVAQEIASIWLTMNPEAARIVQTSIDAAAPGGSVVIAFKGVPKSGALAGLEIILEAVEAKIDAGGIDTEAATRGLVDSMLEGVEAAENEAVVGAVGVAALTVLGQVIEHPGITLNRLRLRVPGLDTATGEHILAMLTLMKAITSDDAVTPTYGATVKGRVIYAVGHYPDGAKVGAIAEKAGLEIAQAEKTLDRLAAEGGVGREPVEGGFLYTMH